MQNLPFFSLTNMEYILFSIPAYSVVHKHISRDNSYSLENEEQVTSYMLSIGAQYKYWLLLWPGLVLFFDSTSPHPLAADKHQSESSTWGGMETTKHRRGNVELETCHHFLSPWLLHEGQRHRDGDFFSYFEI